MRYGGRGRWGNHYKCDKCGREIQFVGGKGFVGLNKYMKSTFRSGGVYKKSFDLCTSCQKKLDKWLKEKEIPTFNEMIDRFVEYKK